MGCLADVRRLESFQKRWTREVAVVGSLEYVSRSWFVIGEWSSTESGPYKDLENLALRARFRVGGTV